MCGADVPQQATVCPGCGADESTGWSEAARYDELGLPEESFNYEEFVQKEFGPGMKRPLRRRFWWVVAVVVLVLFLWLVFRGSF